MDRYDKKKRDELIHALTVARDHLCFLSGLHEHDDDCLLNNDHMVRIDHCIGDIIDVRKKLIGGAQDD